VLMKAVGVPELKLKESSHYVSCIRPSIWPDQNITSVDCLGGK
jgi:hypothetical protein